MKTAIGLGIMVYMFCFAAGAQSQSISRSTVALDSGWEFRQVVAEPHPGASPNPSPNAAPTDAKTAAATSSSSVQWLPAEVPGDVHLDLLRNKLIPDPNYRDNEAKLQWIQDAEWEYRRTLDITPEMLSRQNIELVFEGLDTYSKVYLNDREILTADNMFREWRVAVKSYLKAGPNQLRVVFPSPIKAAAEVARSDKWRAEIKAAEKTYVRKAAYEYGWDWGPTFVTSGIWRPVKLEVWDGARVSDLNIRQRDISAEVAHINAEVEITAMAAASAAVTIGWSEAGHGGEVARKLELRPGLNRIDVPFDIQKPALWYPAGYGAQPIYKFSAQVKVGKQVLDEKDVRTGLRSVVLRREPDPWGRSFEFVINGIPVFAKGADVIPFDSFPSRVTTAQYRRILQSAVDANMNMIRHWGGGYYESDEFYEICDELGIMVWQDFMFGNEWQPGTYAFKQNVEKEVEHQLRRLRNHPSIVVWCGNNETEASWNWERVRDIAGQETRVRMWQDYLTLFSSVIERTVYKMAPETPFWPSSPSADYEDVSENYQSGDAHDWSVWHGRVPFSEYEKHFPRFATEYGFQSFPEQRTIDAFTLPEDRTGIFTPVMLAHQKNKEGNSIIHDYLLRDYPEPKDFPSFLYVSQVLQAEGIKVGAEHLRRLRPRAMGSIYWQLNDCWPVASWSSIDYFGRWKALQYYARRFYSPLLVSPHVENGSLAVYVVSDKTTPTAASLRLRIMKFDGTVLSDSQQAVQVPELSSQIYINKPLSEFVNANGTDAAQIFATADLTIDGKVASRNLVYLAPTKQVSLPAAQINRELTKDGSGYRLRLSSPVLARSVYVSFGELDATPSDNYFDLLPGESLEITIPSAAGLDPLRTALQVRSLQDAFAASSPAQP